MTTIMHILQNYGEVWKIGIITFMSILILLVLAGIFRQIKRLNQSLKSITDNMQAYFNVILTDEPETEKQEEAESEEDIRAQVEAMKKKEEEETLFNAVLREYFS